GVEVEPADGDDPRQSLFLEALEDRLPALRVLFRDHQSRRLVVEPDARALAGRQRLAVHLDAVLVRDVEGGGLDGLPVDGDPPLLDPLLGVAAGTEAGPGDGLGQPVAGWWHEGRLSHEDTPAWPRHGAARLCLCYPGTTGGAMAVKRPVCRRQFFN